VTGHPVVAGVLPRTQLDELIQALGADGCRVIGPTAADGAVVYAEVASAGELPAGWQSETAPGRYRASHAGGERVFDYGQGTGSWKPFVYPPRVPLSVGTRAADGSVTFEALAPEAPPQALLGVRPCELAALGILGRAVRGDDDEAARRTATLTVAVECAIAGSTCFCTSMGTGPGTESGFDLALTELADGFLVRVGSPAGQRVATELPLRPAGPKELAERQHQLAATAWSMGAGVDTDGLPERLRAAADSPRWADIAERCLACGNCTFECPTCFCTSVDQASDLDATESTAVRRWDSCFTAGFGAVAGGNFRPRVRDRYRQWLTHKFGTWPEQFGTFGCVGCGRCVTWCPVGIDVREELAIIAPAPTPAPTPASIPEPTPAPKAPRGPTLDLLPITWPFAPARVAWTARETPDVTTLHLDVDDPAIRAGRPGQFVMAALPGFPPSAISISRYHEAGIELSIRAAGPATAALGRLTAGDELGVRGPLGRPWPLEAAVGRDVLVIAGGIGLAPLRPILDAVQSDPGRYRRLHLCYGARTPSERLYTGETLRLRRCGCADVAETVDRGDADWVGRVGLVTCLLDEPTWDWDTVVAYLCGPERMMQVVASTLIDRGVTPDRIWLTLERHMDCGVGLCGHCQMGSYFVCRDGPVFSLAELGGVFGVEGI
jgi:NAD(P)H-flavin reductase